MSSPLFLSTPLCNFLCSHHIHHLPSSQQPFSHPLFSFPLCLFHLFFLSIKTIHTVSFLLSHLFLTTALPLCPLFIFLNGALKYLHLPHFSLTIVNYSIQGYTSGTIHWLRQRICDPRSAWLKLLNIVLLQLAACYCMSRGLLLSIRIKLESAFDPKHDFKVSWTHNLNIKSGFSTVCIMFYIRPIINHFR